MSKYVYVLVFFVMTLGHSNIFAQEQKAEKEPPKKAKVKIEKMDSRKSKRKFGNDDNMYHAKSTSKEEDRKERKRLKEQREKYEDLRVDQQHSDVTRRMVKNENTANQFNAKKRRTFGQWLRDIELPRFTTGGLFKKKNKQNKGGGEHRTYKGKPS